MLSGYKTYICAAGLVGIAVAKALGYLTAEQAEMLTTLFLGGGLAALRAGVAGK